MIKEAKGKLVSLCKTLAFKLTSVVKTPNIEFLKTRPNIIALCTVSVGVAILAWATQLTLNDMLVWEKDFASALFGSRTGEAISLGIGLNLIHYFIMGLAIVAPSVLFVFRNKTIIVNLKGTFLTQVQRAKKINFSKITIKKTKSGSTHPTKKLVLRNKPKPIANAKTKRSTVFQSITQVKSKITTGTARIIQALNIHATQKRKQTIIISAVAASAILNVVFLSTISAQFFVKNNIYSYGTVQIQTQTPGLGVYRDASCTVKASSLPWGSVAPGGSVSNLVYIKNEGDVPLTLSLNTANWNPSSATNYISLNWNYNGQAIAPNQVVLVRLTLAVSSSINGIAEFNFEISINGSG